MSNFLPFSLLSIVLSERLKRRWVQTLRPILCSLETENAVKAAFAKSKKEKGIGSKCGFVFRLLGTFSTSSVGRTDKTIVDDSPRQLVVLGYRERTLYLSLERKYF